MKKYNIAIVGTKETVLGFKALGLDVVAITDIESCIEKLYELKKATQVDQELGLRPKYAIIFITEDLAMKIPKQDHAKLSGDALPAIIPLPSSKGSTGYGLTRIGKMVEKAIGSDIFGN